MKPIERTFSWQDYLLPARLVALNVPRHEMYSIMEHKGQPFTVFIRERLPEDDPCGVGSPPESWRFIP